MFEAFSDLNTFQLYPPSKLNRINIERGRENERSDATRPYFFTNALVLRNIFSTHNNGL